MGPDPRTAGPQCYVVLGAVNADPYLVDHGPVAPRVSASNFVCTGPVAAPVAPSRQPYPGGSVSLARFARRDPVTPLAPLAAPWPRGSSGGPVAPVSHSNFVRRGRVPPPVAP